MKKIKLITCLWVSILGFGMTNILADDQSPTPDTNATNSQSNTITQPQDNTDNDSPAITDNNNQDNSANDASQNSDDDGNVSQDIYSSDDTED